MRWSSWVVLALLPTVAPATVHVEIRSASEPVPGEVAASRPGDVVPAVVVETSTGTATLDLEAGEWSLTATAAGFWSRPKALDVVRQGQQETVITLWPSGTLSGRVRGPIGVVLPASLDLTFQASPGEEGGFPGASLACPVANGKWSCELPAGWIDLFVGAPGFIRQYLWDVRVPPGELAELRDVFELRSGSALRGWVTTEDRAAVYGARVEFVPRTAAAPKRDAAGRIAARKLSTRVTDRGFFQIDGIAPGAYVATASKDGYAPARASVRVFKDEETEINNPPLTLRRPRILEIYIDPPTPPVGEAWTVELAQIDQHGGSLAETIEGIVPPGEAWRVEGVPDGRYFLDVRTTADREEPGAGVPAWYSETIEVRAETAQVFVTVPAIAVSGRLALGDEPLQGRLIFGTRHGLPRRSLVTNDGGEFSGWLPRAGLWEIDVIAEERSITTRVQRELEAGAVAEIDIEIPDTRLSGQVVTERGDPAADAIVYVRRLSQRIEVFTDDRGVFEAAGLPTGTVSLKAAHNQRKSDIQQVTLRDGAEAPEVILIVRPVLTLTGQVVAPNGAGVAGANVTALVVEDAIHPLPPSQVTDDEGRFELELPSHARNLLLTVAAPGFAFRSFRASALEEPLIVPVSQESGILAIELPESYSPRRWGSASVAVLHNSSGLSHLIQLARWGDLNGQSPKWPTRITAPFMEPGAYSACWAGHEQFAALMTGTASGLDCVSGNLAVSGELTLALSEPDGS
ncbi:MAG: carboxypeptidase regulatory-like domain-containing protein [bacterium]|nr:carboxypeptidase regulatory-like domain-containing protein [bacterium]